MRPSRFRIDADAHQDSSAFGTYATPFSVAEFFKDTPWLRIPEHRRAEIVLGSVYPRGGLLGGASNAGKKSKLASLAAKRRQKENEPPPAEQQATTYLRSGKDYVSSLENLRIGQSLQSESDLAAAKALQPTNQRAPEQGTEAVQSEEKKVRRPSQEDASDALLVVDQIPRGRPSTFASIMTNHDTGDQLTPVLDLPSARAPTKTFNFAEPSPDDIVTKAQSAKGRT